MLKPKKSLGQNFLKSKQLAGRIVAGLDPRPTDIVMEIGPGTGVLTEILIHSRAEIYAVEIDSRMTNFLAQKYAGALNLHIIHGNILEYDLSEIAAKGRIKVIGNLPYQLTSPILERLCNYDNRIERAVLTVQREVAARITAEPHSADYGALTIFANNFCRARKILDLGKRQFHPPPRVDSAVIVLDFHSRPQLEQRDFERIRGLLKKLFSQRRKMIVNSLMSATRLDRARAELILAQAGLDKAARPQDIALSGYYALLGALRKDEVEV